MSVQAQVLSPHSAGLLAGAIAQSGSILYLSTQTPGQEQVISSLMPRTLLSKVFS